MRIKTGIDLIEIDRLENLSEPIRRRFLQRVFTGSELEEAAGSNHRLAGKFAAKEAVSKALGCGIGSVGWQEIEILNGPRGEPELHLHGRAMETSNRQHLEGWSISISHNHSQAVAVAAALAPDDLSKNTSAGE